MVVLDTTILLRVMDPKAKSDIDQAARRVEHLIETLTADMEKIVIPTAVLSEILVHADAAMQDYLDTLNGTAAFRIVPLRSEGGNRMRSRPQRLPRSRRHTD